MQSSSHTTPLSPVVERPPRHRSRRRMTAVLTVAALAVSAVSALAAPAHASSVATQSMLYFETNASTSTQLYAGPMSAGAAGMAPVGAPRSFVLYAIAADPTTGRLYGFARTAGADSAGAPVAIGDMLLVNTTDGTSTNLGTVDGLGAGPAAIPSAATFGPDGTMYVTGVANSAVAKVDPATMTATIMPLTLPSGAAVDRSTGGDITWSNGYLWSVVTGGSNLINRIDVTTGVVDGFDGPGELTAGAVSANATLDNGDLLFSVGSAVPSTALVLHVDAPASDAPSFTVVSSTTVAQRFNDGASISAVADPTVNPANGDSQMSGTAQPGSSVTVSDSAGNVIGSAAVGADGQWVATIAPPLADGAAVTITVVAPSGSSSRIGTSLTIPDAPGTVATDGTTVTGTGAPGSTVTVRDEHGHVIGSGTVDGNGQFSVAVSPPVADGGAMTVTLTDAHGNVSNGVTLTVEKGTPSTTWVRHGGADRYETAVAVARAAYPQGADTVLVATGEAFPDALAAGPVAVAKHAPLLLTQRDAIPAKTLAAIRSLHPSTIVVVGGPNAVTPKVAAQLASLTGVRAVARIGGADRFETSRLLADYGFTGGAETGFIVTGNNFPDAVSASAPAGATGAPILLVNGSAKSLDSATRAQLAKLKVTKTYVVGGTAAVTQGLQNGLPSPTRLAGADRFGTNLAVAKQFYPTAEHIHVATGKNFPDALVGGVLAGTNPGPLLLVNDRAWPKATLAYVKSSGFAQGHLLGGTAVVTDTLTKLNTSF